MSMFEFEKRQTSAFASATIVHQQKDTAYDLADVQQFADEADLVSAELMGFAAHFPKALLDEIAHEPSSHCDAPS